jgi:hypothetical protein
MRKWPLMSYRHYILKFAARTNAGCFYCELCEIWIEKQRWIHFKGFHRFRAGSGL